ncbi:hypothetical protein M9H77_16942 [Catharanthus roseus]|uniref:Uncharacterized protein n=1 Tax=Catharanthus roseus TaxID=4058 RepID=A0ACC0B374_CATRO|nr:hypothetical protein M9H77_16942 [Catharanthus roseus]
MKANTYLIVNRYQKSRISDCRPYVILACKRGGSVRKRTKQIVHDVEEEVPMKRRGPYETKKCQIDNCSYTTGGTAARLTGEPLQQIEQFRKSHVPPRNILRFFREQDVGCALSAQKIYNVVAKIKKNIMQVQKGVTRSFIETVRRATYLYNIPLSETAGMSPTGKNFTVATAFMCNEQDTTYRWILQQIKHIYLIKDKEVVQRFVNSSWHKLINEIDEAEYRRKLEVLKSRVWTSEVLHFGVETTNRAESKHSVLKLWLSTCHGDLDTIFLNIDSVIESQIVEIKSSLEISKLKENHMILKKIWLEIKRASEISDDPQSKCGHYLRKSHGLPCACELYHRYQYLLPLVSEDVYIFWRKLEIGVDIPSVHERDLDSEMCDLTYLLEEISTGPISKVREVKAVISPVLPNDPCASMTTLPRLLLPRVDGRPIQQKEIRSTTVLSLYSNMNCTAGMLCIGFISDQQHFIQMREGCPLPPMQVQWQYHRDVSVSGWADPYYERFVE